MTVADIEVNNDIVLGFVLPGATLHVFKERNWQHPSLVHMCLLLISCTQ